VSGKAAKKTEKKTESPTSAAPERDADKSAEQDPAGAENYVPGSYPIGEDHVLYEPATTAALNPAFTYDPERDDPKTDDKSDA
jgi:hypothetical protein